MKIILVSPYPPPYGGIANWTKLLLTRISENDKDIQILHINSAPKKTSAEGISFIRRIFDGTKKFFDVKKQFNSFLKNNFDIDCVHLINTASLSLLRDISILKKCNKKNIKCVLQFRIGSIPKILSKKKLERKWLIKACKKANKILVLDSKSKIALENIGFNNVSVVPNFIDSVNVNNAYNSRSKDFIFIGWVVKTKGIEELLSAWEKISEKYSDYVLKIVGPYNDKYLKYLKDNFSFKNIIFCGEKSHEDTLKELSGSKALILPSYTEGFPNVILEAMAYQIPCIATDVGAIKDMLGNGDAGIVIRPKNVDDLIYGIEKIINDEDNAINLAKNAKAIVVEKYSIQHVIQQLKEVWKNGENK